MAAERVVIIADDDDGIRSALAVVLRAAGYETRTAQDGAEALLLIDGLGDAQCILVLDLVMPGMNGFDVLDTLSRARRLAQLPVIVCSAAFSTAPLPEGIRHFVPKPVPIDVLLEAIRNLCRDEPPPHSRRRALSA